MTEPFRAVDGAARGQAQVLLETATFAALAVLQDGAPSVTRIGMAMTEDGAPLSLMSSLAAHTAALEADARCALLVGEPGDKGDPLTHPRLTLQCAAQLIAREDPAHEGLRDRYLSQRPKAALYADFADFRFVLFDVQSALLNAGFGKAYRLAATDFQQG